MCVVCPTLENGGEISAELNWVAKMLVKVYVKSPFITTLVILYFNLDPLYYFISQMAISPSTLTLLLLRTVVLTASFVELYRIMALVLLVALLSINILKREIHMWKNIARRSNLGGLYFYRQIFILYTQRREPAMYLFTLALAIVFGLQVR